MKKILYAWTMLAIVTLFFSSCANMIVPSKTYTTQKVTVGIFDGISVSSGIKVTYSQVNTHQSIEVSAPDNLIDYVQLKIKDNKLHIGYKLPKEYSSIQGKHNTEVRISAPAVHTVNASSASHVILKNGLKTAGKIELEASSAGTIKSGRIVCQELDINSSSAGQTIIKKAECQSIETNASSAGKIEIEELMADRVTSEASSAGHVSLNGKCIQAELNASSGANIQAAELQAFQVEAEASSAGNISCHATQSLKASTSSAGNVNYKGNPNEIEHSPKSGLNKLD